MSRNEPLITRILTDKSYLFLICDDPCLSVALFNNVVYENHSCSVQNTARSNGDQVALFYCQMMLDNSESSMLVSAGFESHRPLNS